jgi:hypothetical protein
MVFPRCGDFECDSDTFQSIQLRPEIKPPRFDKNKVEFYLFSCKDNYYKLYDGSIKINLTLNNGGLIYTLLQEYNHYSIGWCISNTQINHYLFNK